MRTTLSIDDSLLASAKARAAECRISLGQYVEQAIRRDLVSPPPRSRRVVIPATGTGGLRPGIDSASNASLYAALDASGEFE
jgi:hypothetical protein